MRVQTFIFVLAFCVLFPLVASAQRLYADQAVLAADPTWISRVKIAAMQYAINNVRVEDVNTADHAYRLAFAEKVIKEPDAWAKLLAVGVVGDLTFTKDTLDAAIFSRIDLIWNLYSEP